MNAELKRILEIVDYNLKNGKQKYEGLSSSDIGRYNQAMMYGENWEAYDKDTVSAYID